VDTDPPSGITTPHPSLENRLRDLGDLVDGWTREIITEAVSEPAARFAAILEYHLGWRDANLSPLSSAAPSGKKLRPALALLVSEAVCGSIEPARASAVAVELVHNFSLVHDDIEDRSRLRRHRQTLWSIWGFEQGINAGDALFALAQIALLRDPSPPAATLAAELNAACLRLAEGQYLDIELQRGALPASLETYAAMIERKTATLFECACRLGALAAGADQAEQSAFATYGRELGLAFQEQDDLLGVWGRSGVTGKPEAADVIERKRGLPAAVALSRADAPEWLKDTYADSAGAPSPELVERIIAYFDHIQVREIIERRVEQRYKRALEALTAASPREPARVYLVELCELLVSRRA
jgi:geranylgeranyl diphosphate synthase type I